MWEISNSGQLLAFLVSFLFGIGYALFYTVFKALRRAFRHSNFSVFLEDIIYFEVIAFITFLLFLAFSNGEIRFFILLAIFLGFIAFYFTLSDVFSRAIAWILRLLRRFVKQISAFVRRTLGIFCKTVGVIGTYCRKKLRNCYKYLKKPLKEGA